MEISSHYLDLLYIIIHIDYRNKDGRIEDDYK